jgi:imidazoleglycerol phosphate synthase glutamine amidotransferase subunit HisH
MRSLRESGLGEAVAQAARAKPFLGLCIGQQMLFERSAEGDTPGLAVIRGEVKGFARRPGMKIPHMGWNEVRQVAPHASEGHRGRSRFCSCTAFVRACRARDRRGRPFRCLCLGHRAG